MFVRVSDDLLMSPGSVALFPACLFAVLLVYIHEDAREARNMIYGLLAANIAASLLGVVVAQHLSGELAFNPLALPEALFVQSPRLFVVGTLALYVDTLLPNVAAGLAAAGRKPDAIDRMIEVKVSFDTDLERARQDTRFWAALALSPEEKMSTENPVEMEKLADALPLERTEIGRAHV